jgi:hypothetical protein
MNRQFGLRALRATLVVAICSLDLLCASADDTRSAAEQRDPSEIGLVEDGQSRYTIVIAANAPLPVRFAAGELQKYLVQISGARLPVSNEASSDLAICVGQGSTPAEDTDKLRPDLKDRGEDGYLMCS